MELQILDNYNEQHRISKEKPIFGIYITDDDFFIMESKSIDDLKKFFKISEFTDKRHK